MLIICSWYAPTFLSHMRSESPRRRKARCIWNRKLEESNPKFLLGVDARFPNVNQTKHCWQNYVDYHKCILAKGEDFAPCRQVSMF